MLDVNDFIAERGGNPEAIRESQRRRFASVEVVDEIISLFEDHRKSNVPHSLMRFFQPAHVDVTAQYGATQLNGKINELQKQIAKKKKVD